MQLYYHNRIGLFSSPDPSVQ